MGNQYSSVALGREGARRSPRKPRAARVGAGEAWIDALIELVWEVLTTFEDWPSWNRLVHSMVTDGGATEGTVFRWKAGPGRITSTIVRVDAPRGIAWTGRTLGIDALHVWRLHPECNRTFVRTEESYDGAVAKLFRRMVHRSLDDGLEQGLADLKAEAERRAAAT